MQGLDRITQSHAVMGGRACIRGMRATVGMVVGQMAADNRGPHRTPASALHDTGAGRGTG